MPNTFTSSYRRGDQFPEATDCFSSGFESQSFGSDPDMQNFYGHRSSSELCIFNPKDEKQDFYGLRTSEPTLEVQEFYGHRSSDDQTFGPKAQKKPKRQRKPRQREKSIYTWIRNRTSNLDCGQLIDEKGDDHPIHLNKNDKVLSHFAKLRCDQRSWLKRISNADFADHQNHRHTFYFAGQAKPKSPETLVLLDIDCKKTGTLEGASAFAEYLRKHHFPNLYIEVSTNGRGAHGFFVLKKFDVGATYINRLLLGRLQPWLRQIMREQNFDVENIEVKGTLPVLVWGEKQFEVTNYKSGTLAKLPRIETREREEDLRNTAVWTTFDLEELPVIEVPKKPAKKNLSAQVVLSESIEGKHIHEDELAELNGHYQDVAVSLLESHELRTKGKTVVTVEDVSIFLMLLKFFTENMNRDGSLPVKRWRQMWTAIKKADDISRAFCPQRFAVIRDHLSSLGLLDWKDKTFMIGWYDYDGKYHKGRSAKWQAGEKLMEMLQKPVVCEAVKKKEEGASFIRTNLTNFFTSLIQAPVEQTIRPIEHDPDRLLRLNPDEIAAYVPPYRLAA